MPYATSTMLRAFSEYHVIKGISPIRGELNDKERRTKEVSKCFYGFTHCQREQKHLQKARKRNK